MIFKKRGKEYKLKRISKKRFNQIKISNAFKNHPPKSEKYCRKAEDFIYHHHKLCPIIVDENYTLMDGYCSYLIAYVHHYRGLRLKIYMAKSI